MAEVRGLCTIQIIITPPLKPTSTAPLVAASEAARVLGVGPLQLSKLIDAGLLRRLGTAGRSSVLDRNDVDALAARPPAPVALSGRNLVGVTVSLSGLDVDGSANARLVVGWHEAAPVPTSAWAGLWNVGGTLANQLVGASIVGAVSGFVVVVREITGWSTNANGLVEFSVKPANIGARVTFAGKTVPVGRGPVWRRLFSS